MALVTFHVSVVSPRTTALDNIDRDPCHHTATSSGLQKDTFLSLPSDALHLNIQESLLSLEKVSQRSDVKNAFLELNCLSFNPGFTICRLFILKRACLVVQTVKNPPALQDVCVCVFSLWCVCVFFFSLAGAKRTGKYNTNHICVVSSGLQSTL